MTSAKVLVNIIFVLALLLMHETNSAGAIASKSYPRIKGTGIIIELKSTSPEIEQELIIKDKDGKPAYTLTILGVSSDGRTTDSIQLSLSTAGRYTPDADERYEPNLLNSDRWGHGLGPWVFLPEELCPANIKDLVRGGRREFRFRRMHIVAEVVRAGLSTDFCSVAECGKQIGGIKSILLRITVKPSHSLRGRPRGVSYKDVRSCTRP
jgi:hypothetical protein